MMLSIAFINRKVFCNLLFCTRGLLDTTERVEILELHVDGAACGCQPIVELHARSVPNLSGSELKESADWRERSKMAYLMA